jgi:molecular chaperone GrpE (heat shock protein)
MERTWLQRINIFAMKPKADSPPSLNEEGLFIQLVEVLWFTRGDLFLYSILATNFFMRRVELCLALDGMDQHWRAEIEKISEMMKTQGSKLIETCTKGEVKVDKKLYDLFRKEMNQMKKVDIQKMIDSVTQPEEFIPNLSELKDQVSKGNRANFKMIQELIGHVEKLAGDLTESRRQYIAHESEQLKDLVKRYTRSLLDMFDMIDLIRLSAEQQGDSDWLKNLEQTVTKASLMLEYHGLEVMNVNGMLFDGTIMEGIGTVSPQEINRELPKYAVYAVTQQGFRQKGTQELVRKAKVITVY